MKRRPHSSSISKPQLMDQKLYKNNNEVGKYQFRSDVSSGSMSLESSVTWKVSFSSKEKNKMASFELNLNKIRSENRNLELNRKIEKRKRISTESINDR